MSPVTVTVEGTPNSFWRFSLALYARPGVARALVTLQDRNGVDVNTVLFGLWLGAVRGHRLTASEFQQFVAITAPIRQAAILPLRQLRRGLPGSCVAKLAPRVAAAELAAERLQLALMVDLANKLPTGEDAAVAAKANLIVCLGTEHDSPEATTIYRQLALLMRRA